VKKILLFTVLLFVMPVLFVQTGISCVIKKATEYVVFPLNEALGTDGLPEVADSAHLITYADNGSTMAYSATSTTFPFADIGIDTIKHYGDTGYWFVDQIQDIDGAGGNFELGIEVTLFCEGYPTSTHFCVQVIGDSLNADLAEVSDILDTLQNQDNWVAKEATVQIIDDTLDLYDTRWDFVMDTTQGIIDTLQNQDNWIATSANQTLIIDTVNGIIDTIQLYDTRLATSANQTLIIDTVNGIIDTLQSWDDEIAEINNAIDSLYAALDSIQNHAAWEVIASDVNINGDTLATMGTDQQIRYRSIVVTNAGGHAVTLTGGAGGGDPVSGDGLRIVSNYGEAMQVIGTTHDIVGDIYGTVQYTQLAPGQFTKISDTSWAHSPRTLTALDEDNTTIDLDATTVGTVTNITNAVLIRDTLAGGEEVAYMPDDWAAADSAGFQGSASGLDSSKVYGAISQAIGDSIASVDTIPYFVYANVDTGLVDSSDIGVWWVNNLSATADTAAFLIALDNNNYMQTTDSAIVDVSSAGALAGLVADSTWEEKLSEHNTTLTFGAANGDSLATTSDIADGVWNEDTAGHYVVGKFGYEATQSGSGSDTASIKIMMDNNSFAKWGTSVQATLRTLSIVGTGTHDTAVYIKSSGDSPGLLVRGGTNGDGTKFIGGSVSGHGFYTVGGASGIGFLAQGTSNNPGFKGYGNGSGAGIYALGGLTGYGAHYSSPGDYAMYVNGSNGAYFNGTAGNDITGDLAGSVTSVTNDVTIADADMGMVADSVLLKDTSDVTGGFGLMMKDTSAYQGAAAGLDSTAVWGAVSQVVEDSSLTATNIDSSGVSGAINAFWTDSATTIKVKELQVGDIRSDSIVATLGGSVNTVSNLGTVTANVYSISGDVSAADNLESMLDGNRATLWLDQLNIVGTNGASGAVYMYNADGPAMKWGNGVSTGLFDGTFTDTNFSAAYYDSTGAGNGGGSDTTAIKKCAENNPSIFYGPTNAGSGEYTVIIYAIDSSSVPDSLLEGIPIAIQNASGNNIAGLTSDGNGYCTFTLDAGSYTVLSSPVGYQFSPYSLTVTANDDSVGFCGYDTQSPSYSTIYGYIYDVSGNIVYGALIEAEPSVGKNVSDSLTGRIITPGRVETRTDSLGYFCIDLQRTGTFPDTTYGFYDIRASLSGDEIFNIKSLYVPDNGNVGIDSVLATRSQ